MKPLSQQLAEAQADYIAALSRCKAGRSIEAAIALRKVRDLRHRLLRKEVGKRRRKAA